MKKILCVCSSGGHSIQMRYLISSILELKKANVTVYTSSKDVFDESLMCVDESMIDFNRSSPYILPYSLFKSFLVFNKK